MKLTEYQQERVEISKSRAAQCSKKFISSCFVENEKIFVDIHPLLCNSPYCHKCNLIKRYKLLERLQIFCKNRTCRFLTLTYSTDYSVDELFSRYQSDFNKFLTYIRRLNYKFEYFKIIEFTKKQRIHFHLIIDTFIPQSVISSVWRNVTKNSYVVFITKKMKNQILINYLLKYLTKSFHGSNDYFVAFNIRRYSFSKNSVKLNKNKKTKNKSLLIHYQIFNKTSDLILYYLTNYQIIFHSTTFSKFPEFEFR